MTVLYEDGSWLSSALGSGRRLMLDDGRIEVVLEIRICWVLCSRMRIPTANIKSVNLVAAEDEEAQLNVFDLFGRSASTGSLSWTVRLEMNAGLPAPIAIYDSPVRAAAVARRIAAAINKPTHRR